MDCALCSMIQGVILVASAAILFAVQLAMSICCRLTCTLYCHYRDYSGAFLTILSGKYLNGHALPYSSTNPADKAVWDKLTRLSLAIANLVSENKPIEFDVEEGEPFDHPYDRVIYAWTKVLELRDFETMAHTQRVTLLSLDLGREMGLVGDELVHMRRGAMLHDIGKLGISDKILLKPGPLTTKEREIMRQHPVLAYLMLSSIDFLYPALDIPLSHHEKWDGTGYPYGLSGRNIPLAARIFAIVDVWDALNSSRPYRLEPWSKDRIVEYLIHNRGKYFDPQVVEAFLAHPVTDFSE